MKVVIAYDGSTYPDAAIDDLNHTGLPHDSHVLVASVVDFSDRKPTYSEFDLLSVASRRVDAVLEQARRHEAAVLKETRAMVSKIVRRLRRQFPDWTVHSEVLRGKPADSLLEKVREWKPDLIMGGSQGRSSIGRFFLGSVLKSVAEKASCSVRVVRSGFEEADSDPIEIILGVKNPAEAERIVKAVGRRVWPADTRIRLIAVDEASASGRFAAYRPSGKSIYETAADSLTAVSLKVSVQIESGDAEAIFLDAAEVWRADAIFVSAGRANDQGLDETSSSLITTAKCTVEVVR